MRFNFAIVGRRAMAGIVLAVSLVFLISRSAWSECGAPHGGGGGGGGGGAGTRAPAASPPPTTRAPSVQRSDPAELSSRMSRDPGLPSSFLNVLQNTSRGSPQQILVATASVEILDAPGWARVAADRHQDQAASSNRDADGYHDFAERIRHNADRWRELADSARRNAERNRQRARDARRDGHEDQAADWEKEAQRDDEWARRWDEEGRRLDDRSREEARKEDAARERARQARQEAERAREEARRIERERSERERQRAEDEARRQQAERDARRAREEAAREEARRTERERREADRREARRREARREHERRMEEQRQAEERRARAAASGREAERTGGRRQPQQGGRPPAPPEEETTWADLVIEYGGAVVDWFTGKAQDEARSQAMERTGITTALENAGLEELPGALGDGIDDIMAVKNLGDSMNEELERMPNAQRRIEDRIDNLSDPRSNTNRRETLSSGSLYGDEVGGVLSRMIEANH